MAILAVHCEKVGMCGKSAVMRGPVTERTELDAEMQKKKLHQGAALEVVRDEVARQLPALQAMKLLQLVMMRTAWEPSCFCS